MNSPRGVPAANTVSSNRVDNSAITSASHSFDWSMRSISRVTFRTNIMNLSMRHWSMPPHSIAIVFKNMAKNCKQLSGRSKLCNNDAIFVARLSCGSGLSDIHML